MGDTAKRFTALFAKFKSNLNYMAKKAPEAKSVAEIINQLQKLVAGGLLLQANDLVSLVKKSQVFIEETFVTTSPLSEKDIDVLHQLSLIFDQLTKSENPQKEYQLAQQNINNLSETLTENLSESELEKNNEVAHLTETSFSSASEKQTEQLSSEKDRANINIAEIFNKELQIGINLLIECVLKIEQGSARLNDYKEMMRCAHSLKGGARLAGLNNVVTLAHNLEDIFTKVQNGEHSFKSDDIDILMRLIDMSLPLRP
ncbi:Hpt domain-containing protein [Psychromonas sp. KJ10-10]|uniref:Hpt domain-containing protein n=1 Tax=Psychromonas sp. KJ10-10 TaxID=3391823 RepID=UPI0039B662E1